MKVRIDKEVKRSDGLWRFACGDVLYMEGTTMVSRTLLISEGPLFERMGDVYIRVFGYLGMCIFVGTTMVPLWSPRCCSCQMMGIRDGANWLMGHCRCALSTTLLLQKAFFSASAFWCSIYAWWPNIIRFTAFLFSHGTVLLQYQLKANQTSDQL